MISKKSITSEWLEEVSSKNRKGNYELLIKGITQVKRFIFSESYQMDRAITDASKAAYIAKVIEHGVAGYEFVGNTPVVLSVITRIELLGWPEATLSY